ncbi:hypothetical protein TBLA_0G02780 [Henningerozyma blattae CBS 6284]|uniref:non-specific serine/threonine protein kinase n=1 Tax=Henningerozyma blattae (strain ATCC 34711 / CBS 6284 / DSM 70876 / NBRC 10599 / NRRL Y-10934 / UCD 77-7) TaxID=1071380 RepID=I2H764_HENB6|nr:hypothetical protein TBLA_0G02780 [Tetrapisispora blattae CBS 6284]CCH62216.1 hypothetical protein TBLA_0G02780 [Tetrapisispora blattae CBS 6284]
MQSNHQHIVGIHYAVGPKIGEGSFGVIFEGEDILQNDSKNNSTPTPVAIKFEPRRSDTPQLRDEFRAYKILNDCNGIPNVYYYGQEGMHNVLIIDLLGPSLEDLFEWCGRKFSIKTTCMLAKQMIDRIRCIHEHDLIYRDIKPDNFLISQYQRISPIDGSLFTGIAKSACNDPSLIYLVDFGMAKQYRDPKTKKHIPYRERKSLSGTARYMSINTHFGKEQSRRDDLESLGHVFFYFLLGNLPWQGLKAPNNKLKYEKIGLTKQRINPDDLLTFNCATSESGNPLPQNFATYLKYVRALKFDETPDYNYLISLMDDTLLKNGLKDDGNYDWLKLNNGRGWNIKINKRINLHGYGHPNPKHTRNANNTNNNNTTNPNNNGIHGHGNLNSAAYNNNNNTNINVNSQQLNNNNINLTNSRTHSHSHNHNTHTNGTNTPNTGFNSNLNTKIKRISTLTNNTSNIDNKPSFVPVVNDSTLSSSVNLNTPLNGNSNNKMNYGSHNNNNNLPHSKTNSHNNSYSNTRNMSNYSQNNYYQINSDEYGNPIEDGNRNSTRSSWWYIFTCGWCC